MNELKQIRSMAEMIIEKVDALEGANPCPRNTFSEFVPELNVWMPKFAIGDTVYYAHRGGNEEWTCVIKQIHPTYNSYLVESHGGRHETWVAEKFLRSEPTKTEPKFAVGDCVGTSVGDRGRVTGIHRLDGHYRFRYLVLFDNGNHHHVAEPLLKLVEPKVKPDPQLDRDRNGSLYDRGGADSYYGRPRNPHWYPDGTYKGTPVKDLTPVEIAEYNAGYDACSEPTKTEPKFAVGDRVHFVNQKNQLVQAPISRMAFNDSGCYVKGKWHYWFDRSEHNTDTNFIPAGGMPEHLLTKVENERVWHSGPPPHIGWWNASLTKRNDSWRWWNGSSWSEHVTSFNTANEAHGTAMWVETAERNAEIKWSDYWPADARVPRVDPGVK